MDIGALKGEPLAAECLAAGLTYTATAKACGIGLRTVTARMGGPDYRRHVLALRSDLLGRAAGLLAADAPAAAEALRAMRNNLAEDSTVRRLCAVATLDFAAKLCAAVELAERVAGLEADLESLREEVLHGR